MTETLENTDMVLATGALPTPGPVPAAPTRPEARRGAAMPLRRDQKAAIIVRLLKSGEIDLPLEDLETNTLAQLIRATAELSFVSEADTLQVISDFLSEIKSMALYFQPGLKRAMDAFREKLNENVQSILMSDVPPEAPEDPWPVISVAGPQALAKIITTEMPQVCSVVLAKLPSDKAAEVLEKLNPELAQATTLAATQLSGIPSKYVMDIGLMISQSLRAQTSTGALDGDPVARVGAILNFTPGPTREKLLGSIEAKDPELAEKMRRIMFTFADIPDRLEIKDVPKAVRSMENTALLTALVGGQESNPETVEYILANLSKRLAEQLKEEMKELGEVKVKDAEAAMTAVIQSIKDLEDAGQITLVMDEE